VGAVSNVCQPCVTGTFALEGSARCTATTEDEVFIYEVILQFATTAAEFDTKRDIFQNALANVYGVPSHAIEILSVTAVAMPATVSLSRRLATSAAPQALVDVLVAITFRTPASERAPVDLAMINSELAKWPLFPATGVTSIPKKQAAKKQAIWGIPVLFFWAGCGVLGLLVFLVICTAIIVCPKCNDSRERGLREEYPMLPGSANPAFPNSMQNNSATSPHQAPQQGSAQYAGPLFQNQAPPVEQTSYLRVPIFYE